MSAGASAPAGGPPAYAGAYVHRSAVGNNRAARGALFVAALIGAGILFLLALAVIAGEAGLVGLLGGLFMALLPVPIYVALALLIDRYEPEPVRVLISAFLWGATASFFIAFILNTIGTLIVSGVFGPSAGAVFGPVISAPIVEESAKAVVLFAIFFFRRNEFNGVIDGIVYAAMVGLGFATTENILYYAREFGSQAAAGTPVNEVVVFIVRGVLSPFAHPLFTAMTGLGLAIAAGSRHAVVKLGAPLLGLGAAMLLHAIWNGVGGVGGELALLVVYVLFFVPTFIGIIVMVVVARRRELRLVGTHLQHDVGTGLIPASELGVLSSRAGRKQAMQAAKRMGTGAQRARKQFHVASVELALHRHKVSTGAYHGHAPDQDDLAYQEQLRSLQPQFGGAPGPAATQPTPAAEVAAQPAPAATQQARAATAIAPGWHPDPYGQARLRWWDGSEWSQHTAA